MILNKKFCKNGIFLGSLDEAKHFFILTLKNPFAANLLKLFFIRQNKLVRLSLTSIST